MALAAPARKHEVNEVMGVSVEVQEASKIYGAVTALAPTTLTIEKGSFTTIVGPSGCGKSTLLDIIAGLSSGHTGSVRIDGRELQGPRRETGVIFQQAALLPWRTVLDNVAFGMEISGVPKPERHERAREVLDTVGLGGFAAHYPHQLSGGMKQRAAIARVLTTKPDLMLADEPFGALDEQTRVVLGLELHRIARETGATIVFITHSIQEAVLLSDRVILMSARPGTIILDEQVALPHDHRDPEMLGDATANELEGLIWGKLRAEVDRARAQERENR